MAANKAANDFHGILPQTVLRTSAEGVPRPGDIYQLMYSTIKPSIFWVVRNAGSGWTRVEAGHPHPIQVQYVLSIRKDPHGPSWVKKDTWQK